MGRRIVLVAMMAAVVGVSGCYESSEVKVHEPGKYMGSKDQLAGQQASSREEQLRKRFQLVQVDR